MASVIMGSNAMMEIVALAMAVLPIAQ